MHTCKYVSQIIISVGGFHSVFCIIYIIYSDFFLSNLEHSLLSIQYIHFMKTGSTQIMHFCPYPFRFEQISMQAVRAPCCQNIQNKANTSERRAAHACLLKCVLSLRCWFLCSLVSFFVLFFMTHKHIIFSFSCAIAFGSPAVTCCGCLRVNLVSLSAAAISNHRPRIYIKAPLLPAHTTSCFCDNVLPKRTDKESM